MLDEISKNNLTNKKLTTDILVSCLATCEPVISKNAYLEKKWIHCGNNGYREERLKWMEYRKKLQSALLPMYSMKQIIQMTKGCTNKCTQKDEKYVIELIEANDYELM